MLFVALERSFGVGDNQIFYCAEYVCIQSFQYPQLEFCPATNHFNFPSSQSTSLSQHVCCQSMTYNQTLPNVHNHYCGDAVEMQSTFILISSRPSASSLSAPPDHYISFDECKNVLFVQPDVRNILESYMFNVCVSFLQRVLSQLLIVTTFYTDVTTLSIRTFLFQMVIIRT